MRIIRLVLASALCPMSSILAQDTGGQGKAPRQILVGVGLGRRESPRIAETDYGHAWVVRVSLRFRPERLLVVEPEIGYWQETRVRFPEDPARERSITTREFIAGLNLLLRPRVGPIHLRAGGGAGFVYYHDDEDPSATEVLLGVNLQLGAELDVSERIGVFGVVRGEAVGLGTSGMLYGGLRIRLR
jgi:hypothetical protein